LTSNFMSKQVKKKEKKTVYFPSQSGPSTWTFLLWSNKREIFLYFFLLQKKQLISISIIIKKNTKDTRNRAISRFVTPLYRSACRLWEGRERKRKRIFDGIKSDNISGATAVHRASVLSG
jgi:hypothetical protein